MSASRPPPSFGPVTPDYGFQKVADAIRQAVADGTLAPGDRLPPQRALQEQFGVSKVTVMGALRVLEADGIIRTQVGRHGGAIILDPRTRALARGIDLLVDLDQVNRDEVREFRVAVEVLAARLAVERGTAAQFAHLEDLLTRLEALDQRPETVLESGHLDLEFHLTLAGASGNRLIRACMDVLYAHVVDRQIQIQRGDQVRLNRSLRQLLDRGLKRRSPGAAERAIRQHLADSFAIVDQAPPRTTRATGRSAAARR